jgi:hypothetical protein
MLTIRRFQVLAESYGADLQRWPQQSRAEAQRLLTVSSEARQLLAEARILDAAIMEVSTQDPLSPAEQVAALERLKSAVASRLATSSGRRTGASFFGWMAGWFHEMATPRRLGLATGVCAAVIAGLVVGSLYNGAPATRSVLTFLQPDPMQLFGDLG